ncbi:MAG: TIM-barrel domain-containing protein [Candidatus Bathyarchaeia archaeon]
MLPSLLLSLCFQFWSHDIGGFEQTASADVYKRWCAFGLLTVGCMAAAHTVYLGCMMKKPWMSCAFSLNSSAD